MFPALPGTRSVCRWSMRIGLALLASGCSQSSSGPVAPPESSSLENLTTYQSDAQVVFLQSGSLTLTRQMPAVAQAPQQGGPSSLLAFSPLPQTGGAWLVIDRKKKTISLISGDQTIQTARGEGIENLTPGRFTVEHKQRSPLWYAPATYFTRRNLPVPPEGGKERYLRGALGDFSIFLNKDTPLHDGPVWSSELGGIKLEENDISRLYYQVEVGTPVEIK